MKKDVLLPGNSVLLLGEGNFSFSLSILKDWKSSVKVTATCLQTVLSAKQKENCQALKHLGASIYTGVDATKIHEHYALKNENFDRIIFNFPHTGGKMKIHLNRALLRLFFVSASKVLKAPEGRVIVTLCSGQGADFMNKRCWGDSWQVVDMAGHANLVLLECFPFDWSLFPNYDNVGYRSQEKGFHTDGALVHVFHPVQPNYCEIVKFCDLSSNHFVCNLQSMPVHARIVKQNVLNTESSAVFFILKLLYESTKSQPRCQLINEMDVKYQTSILHNISYILSLWKSEDTDIIIYSGYVFNELRSNFDQTPVSIQTLLLGKENFDVFDKFLHGLMATFNKRNLKITIQNGCSSSNIGVKILNKIFIQEENHYCLTLIAEHISIYVNNKLHKATLIYTDIITCIFFSLSSWRQLWAESAKVQMRTNIPVITDISPYPYTYTFDMSFFVNENFMEEKMYEVLWNVAGEIVVNVKKIDEFVSPEGGWESKCYRFSYLSFDKPMFREGILYFHQEVLGKILSSTLKVSIR